MKEFVDCIPTKVEDVFMDRNNNKENSIPNGDGFNGGGCEEISKTSEVNYGYPTDICATETDDGDDEANQQLCLTAIGLQRISQPESQQSDAKLTRKISTDVEKKLLKCHYQCYLNNESHKKKHSVDISSPLGIALTTKDVVDEEYIKKKQVKLEECCRGAFGTSSRKTKKKHFGRPAVKENPVLEQIRQWIRQPSSD